MSVSTPDTVYDACTLRFRQLRTEIESFVVYTKQPVGKKIYYTECCKKNQFKGQIILSETSAF